MDALPFSYWQELTSQFIFLCALLGGFSFTTVVALLGKEQDTRVMKAIFRTAIIAAATFLIAVFAANNIFLMTAEGYPRPVSNGDLSTSRAIFGLSFFAGILSMMALLALAGWTKSKSLGWFTTIVSLISLTLIFITMSS